jgi:Ca2+/H+ antiporter, TMEM165/GDT1 family
MSAFFISFAIIFVAELGDKSQLVALWFATKYRWWLVISAVTIATLVVHLGSVAIGMAAGELLPAPLVLTLVGLSFFGFAWWSLRGDSLDEDATRLRFTRFGALAVVTVAFFLSELGDKTQLATISLAGRDPDVIGVWLGSTAGMVAADGLAVFAGVVAGARLPDRLIARFAAALFVAFGVLAFIAAANSAV